MSAFDDLLEAMAPGVAGAETPDFPRSLDLEPREILGEGGEAVVYRAWDPVMEREVAVKVSRRDAPASARESLLVEAQRQGRVRHPGVLPVHRIEVADGRMCVVMELAPARNLGHWMREPPRSTDREDTGRIAHELASALAFAHSVDVIHGDLHPGNVALTAGLAPRLLDWMGHPSRRGHVTGDPLWLAPERLAGEPASAEGDVYSLGALLVAMHHRRPHRVREPGQELGAFLRHWSTQVPPHEPLPEEWEEWAQACLSLEPSERPSMSAVRDGLSALMSGAEQRRRRHSEAQVLLERGRASLERYRGLAERLRDEHTVVTVQRAKVAPHAPVEQKKSLWEAESRVHQLTVDRARSWLDAVDAVTRGRSFLEGDVPEAIEADRLLARLWWERSRDSALQDNPREERVALERARALDDGSLFRAIDARGQVVVQTDVPEATIRYGRVDTVRRVWCTDSWVEALAPETLSLEPGRWMVEVSADGYRTTRVPLMIGAHEERTLNVRLWTEAQIGTEWVYMPEGRFILGGDSRARQALDRCQPHLGDRFLTRTCITTAEYKAFLDGIDRSRAREYVPAEAGLFGGSRPLWTHTDDGWMPPDLWSMQWPVVLVSIPDIEAYAAWRSEQEGRVCRLPTEEEWEKAARGVDGRPYPWGRAFDPTYAHMRQSRPGPPMPAAVGSYPVDRSVYGCMDMAGGVREFTGSDFDEGQRVVRGGTWGDDAEDLRTANRSGLQPAFRMAFVGFRLVTEEPRSPG